MNLYRVILPVTDITKAVTFYSFVLGQSGKRVSSGRHYFDVGGTILAIYDPIADRDDIQKEWSFHENQYIYISTDTLEDVHQKVKQSECSHVDETIETMPWGERLFYANDPFGNPICFVDQQTVFRG